MDDESSASDDSFQSAHSFDEDHSDPLFTFERFVLYVSTDGTVWHLPMYYNASFALLHTDTRYDRNGE